MIKKQLIFTIDIPSRILMYDTASFVPRDDLLRKYRVESFIKKAKENNSYTSIQVTTSDDFLVTLKFAGKENNPKFIEDGGFVVANWTTSFGAGNRDFWVFKLNRAGTLLWERSFGGSGDDRFAAAWDSDLDVIAAARAISEGKFAPAINCDNKAEGCNLNIVKEPVEKPIKHVLCCSYTFGGQTAALVLKNVEGEN